MTERSDARVAMDAIRRIVRILREGSREAEKRVGISGAQLFVLRRLGDRGALTIGELATATATHQSSVSVVVRRLVERRLVSRGVADADRRRREVALTAAGRRLLDRAPGAAQDRLLAGLAALPAVERRRLAAGLSALVKAIGAGGEPAEMFFEGAVRRTMGSHGFTRPSGLGSTSRKGGNDAARGRQASSLSRPRDPRARRDRARP